MTSRRRETVTPLWTADESTSISLGASQTSRAVGAMISSHRGGSGAGAPAVAGNDRTDIQTLPGRASGPNASQPQRVHRRTTPQLSFPAPQGMREAAGEAAWLLAARK